MTQWKAWLGGALLIVSLTACNEKSSVTPLSVSDNTCEPLTTASSLSLFSTLNKRLQSANIAVNQVPITSGCGYFNEPCVSVTICAPGTSDCQTIDNVLLDTGSEGLRLFSCVVTVGLTPQTVGGNALGECVTYADTTQQWGSVQLADVTMGSQTASNIPIQIIDTSFQTVPAGCSNAETSAAVAGYNGILGVGLSAQDCGAACVITNNGIYYSCANGSCTSVATPVAQQVANPVYALSSSSYNNGVVIDMPAVSSAGGLDVQGNMYLGLSSGYGTNNQVNAASAYFADGNHKFRTTYNGITYSSSFIDSGSNGLFFPTQGTVADCAEGTGLTGFLCPTSTMTLSATMNSALTFTANPTTLNFFIANAVTMAQSGNNTFYNLGGNYTSAFDWGFPFFLGRRVIVGFDGRTSTLGTGPYWAW